MLLRGACMPVRVQFDQRFSYIVQQITPFLIRCGETCDEYIVITGLSVEGQKQSCSFAQAALGTVTSDGIADFFGCGEPRTAMRCV